MCRPWRSSACLTSSLAHGPALSHRRAHQKRSSTRSIVRSTPRSLLPATQAKLQPLEAQAMFGTPQDYADFLAGELPKWIAMAKLSGAAAD